MQFLKNLLRNIGLLMLIFLVVYLINPTLIKQAYELLGALFGPLLIVMVIAAALPGSRRRGV